MTPQHTTRDVAKAMYANYLKRAEECQRAAQHSFGAQEWNAATINAIHASIAAVDALCVYFLGKRHAGDSHNVAVVLFKTLPLEHDWPGWWAKMEMFGPSLTGDVLMLAYANDEAVRLTRETGFAHYFSRSRQRLWKKGETSGDYLRIDEIRINCEQNSLLFLVTPEGKSSSTAMQTVTSG